MRAIEVEKIIAVIENDAKITRLLMGMNDQTCVIGGLLVAAGVHVAMGRASVLLVEYVVLESVYGLNQNEVGALMSMNDSHSAIGWGVTSEYNERVIRERRRALIRRVHQLAEMRAGREVAAS